MILNFVLIPILGVSKAHGDGLHIEIISILISGKHATPLQEVGHQVIDQCCGPSNP